MSDLREAIEDLNPPERSDRRGQVKRTASETVHSPPLGEHPTSETVRVGRFTFISDPRVPDDVWVPYEVKP